MTIETVERHALPAERAAKGAQMLDRLRPDWHTRVNPDRLNVGSTLYCVVGQLYGSRHGAWMIGAMEIVGDALNMERPDWGEHCVPFVREHGLLAVDQGTDGFLGDGERLSAAWRKEIEQRRAA